MSDIIASAFANLDPENEQFVNKNIDIVEEVYRILSEKKMSQSELAQKLGKSSAEVSKWLSGTHNLTLRSVTKIEVALGVDLIETISEAKKKYQKVNYVHISKDAQRNKTTDFMPFESSSFEQATGKNEFQKMMIA